MNNMKKRIMACLLAGLMVLSQNFTVLANTTGSVSQNRVETDVAATVNTDGEAEKSAVSDNSVEVISLSEEFHADGEGETIVTRIEWLKALTALFEFTVEEDNYPDNYYSDIDSSSEDYYDVMLATEFGLIDVEAGSAFEPEGVATREFVAHTLNSCLGYVPTSESYSFNEAATVTYPDDIQAAIEKEWFQLADGNFLPEQAVTVAEKEAILTQAKEIKEVKENSDTDGTYQYKDNVIVLPEDTEIETTAENELTITDCPVTIQAGNLFGIVYEGMPLAWKAVSVETTDNLTVITFENVSPEDAFDYVSVSGSYEADLSKVTAASDDVEISYVVGGTEEAAYEDGIICESIEEVGDREVNAIIATEEFDISEQDRIKFNIGDAEVKATCKIIDKDVDHKVTLNSAYVDCYFTVDFQCTVGCDVLEASGISSNLTLFNVELGPGIFATFALDLECYGEVNVKFVENVVLGVHYEKGDLYINKSFKKKSFTFSAQTSLKVGLKLSISLNIIAIKGSLTGRLGIKGTLVHADYEDGAKPDLCQSMSGYMYANMGYNISVNLAGVYTETLKAETLHIFDEKNSPVKVCFHYEDGKEVPSCTRGTKGMGYGGCGYFSPVNSQYYYNGKYSTGTLANGETYTIFTYSLNDENQATITGYQGTAVNVFIPKTLDGYEVVAIGNSAFKNNTRIRSVSIADSVTSIGNKAFDGCSKLENVQLPQKLNFLGSSAFRDCKLLTEIEIPKSLNEIGTYVNYTYYHGPFQGCDNLKKVSFETGTTSVCEYLFMDCAGLEEITIPDTVTNISTCAFSGCTSLKSVNFSTNLTQIQSSAFSGCTSLTEVKIPDTVLTIGNKVFDGCEKIKEVHLSTKLNLLGSSAFRDCKALTEIEIPKSLNEIGTYVNYTYYHGPFQGCENLKKVSFETGTTSVCEYLFMDCVGLEEITIPDTVINISTCAFSGCRSLRGVNFSTSLTQIQSSAFSGCTSLTEVRIPDTVLTIGNKAFDGCKKIEEVHLPRKLNSLGSSAFRDCESLIEIEVPKSLKEMGSYLNYTYYHGPFQGCNNLKTASFENGTTAIIDYLFMDCNGLEVVTIPDTVTKVGDEAFSYCTALKGINLPNSVIEIGDSAFCGCSSLEDVTLTTGIVSLGSSVFANCTSLKEAYIPDTVTDMGGYHTFSGCTSLEKVHIPNIRKNIGTHMFYNCENLSEINLPDTLEAVRSNAFYNCDALTSITLPANVTTIESNAFYDCDNLTTATIPNSVTEMGTYAFYHCDTLSNVSLGTGLTQIPSYAFSQCAALESVIIPYQVTKLNNNAFYADTALTEITLPRSVTTIGTNVFSYPAKMTIYGISGTYAETYANENSINFVSKDVPATSVTLSQSDMTMNRGDEKQLFITVAPTEFTDAVSWKSTNEDIATVAADGTVEAVGVGTATIKVNVGNVSASCKVTVNQPVTSIRLNSYSETMEAGATFTLIPTVYPSNANVQTCTFISSDPTIANVTAAGVVTALKKGTATITVKATDGSETYNTCKITVNSQLTTVTGVEDLQSTHPYENNSADSWTYTIPGAGSLSVKFNEKTEVEDGFDYIYIYDKNNNLIGTYTGKELAGKTITVSGDTIRIQIKADDSGNSYGFAVDEVKNAGQTSGNNSNGNNSNGNNGNPTTGGTGTTPNPGNNTNTSVKVQKIKITGISKKIAAGKKIRLKAEVTPANVTNPNVTWKSSNKKYATVTSNGKVTLKKAGVGKTVTITATATDGSNVKAVYKIKIMKHAVKSVKLKAASKSVKAGKTVKVKATIKTTGKKVNKTLKWTSSNTKYATVSSKGIVKAKKAGKGKTVTITATSTDGTNKKAKVKIKIK